MGGPACLSYSALCVCTVAAPRWTLTQCTPRRLNQPRPAPGCTPSELRQPDLQRRIAEPPWGPRAVHSQRVDRLIPQRTAPFPCRQAGAEVALEEVHSRHLEFLQIERGMLELHQMYLDMATLVEGQGEQLDSIELQVSKATEYTVQARSRRLCLWGKKRHDAPCAIPPVWACGR